MIAELTFAPSENPNTTSTFFQNQLLQTPCFKDDVCWRSTVQHACASANSGREAKETPGDSWNPSEGCRRKVIEHVFETYGFFVDRFWHEQELKLGIKVIKGICLYEFVPHTHTVATCSQYKKQLKHPCLFQRSCLRVAGLGRKWGRETA